MFYELRIEPKKDMRRNEVISRIEKAFEDVGLTSEGIEIINVD